jgi:phage terminase small subunit
LKKEYRTRTKPLTSQQVKFVELYCNGANATQAAIGAGFAPQAAHTRGWKLLEMDQIKEAVEDYRKKVARALDDSATYTVKEAVEEIEQLIKFARQTGNANAYSQALKQKQALYGLGEKDKAEANNFQINITGLAAPKGATVEVEAKESIFD